MALRLIGETQEQDRAVQLRLSSRAVLIWEVIWTVLSTAALIVFWVRAAPIEEIAWIFVITIGCVLSAAFLVAISKIDTTLVMSAAPVLLFLAVQSTNWAEAMAVWSTAFMIGSLLRIRHLGDVAETVAYLIGSAIVALLVRSWLDGLGVPWPILAVAFVTAYMLARLFISTIRLLVVTRLGLRSIVSHMMFRRMALALLVMAGLAISGEFLRRMIGAYLPNVDYYWGGALVTFTIGFTAAAIATIQESRRVSSQLNGTLTAANSLPWSSAVEIEQHALKFARLALPQYSIDVQRGDHKSVNEITSSLGEQHLVARRGTAQQPFLVQDQRVLDAIAHIAVTMAATYREREDLERSALTDDLTGLPNYRGFHDFLARTAETAEEGFAVVYVDVDHFKEVNDRHGHEVGNTVLRSLATRMRARRAPGDLVARLGGDEFVIVLTGVANEQEAHARAAQLLTDVSAPIVLDTTVIALSLSSGIAFSEPGASNVSDLVEAADARMYAERGRQVLGDAAPVAQLLGAQEVSALSDAVRSAIVERRLSVRYQPIVDAVDNRIIGFEALIRAGACELVNLPPDVIVHEAQRLGLLTELSVHVIETAARDLQRFQLLVPSIEKVNVNIDVEQVTDPEFLSVLHRVTDASGVNLALELSETSLNRSSDDLHRELQRLREEMSIEVALDDFGQRSSTLLSLLQYSADILKIDKALVQDMHLPKQQTVMRSMVLLAENLGIDMVVEGVEDAEVSDALVRLGVRYMQGYLFGAAEPAESLIVRLRRHGDRALGTR